MKLQVNGQTHRLPAGWAEDSLLMVLREAIGLASPKFGCGLGQCGACTVHVDGEPRRSCLLPAAAVADKAITTLEGLASPDGSLHPVQQAWLDEAVPQCGYCQSGQIMAVVALLKTTPRPNAAQIDAALAPHLCRCGTQPRARRAVMRLVASLTGAAR